ncbi:hypothetical protein EXIGLDRAFT_10518 [Exidia glandulosa HHB12029]|uniref:NTF2 domain-containing protein n=1 Tax=Exidia glandulosa HHB12029 TaxID=1314781 RepID=A0A165QRR7_EXIGL|nr:hypothetical protein EXIGLDRAFT_10518 [Exidia glandulosa HHB12029]
MSIIWESETPVMLVCPGKDMPRTSSELQVVHPATTANDDPLALPGASHDETSALPSTSALPIESYANAMHDMGERPAAPAEPAPTISESEILLAIPTFLRGLPANDSTLRQWMNLETEQLRSVDGVTVLEASLDLDEHHYQLRVINPADASGRRRPGRRWYGLRETIASEPSRVVDEAVVSIPAFIRDDVHKNTPRGQLWLRAQVDSAEQTHSRHCEKHEVVRDQLRVHFTTTQQQEEPGRSDDETHPIQIDSSDQPMEDEPIRDRKRKRSISKGAEAHENRRSTPPRLRQPSAAPPDAARDSEQDSLPTPAPTQVDEDEPDDDRMLASGFLHTYFQEWDGDRKRLPDAYAPEAVFSYQLHDIPSQTNPSGESKEDPPKLLYVGRPAIMETLSKMGTYVYGYGADVQFDMHRLPEMDHAFMLVAHGDFRDGRTREVLNYSKAFILKKKINKDDADIWSFVILSQQLTIRNKLPTQQ